MNGLPAPKRVFKRGEKLEINPLLLQAFGITAEELAETIRSAEEPEAMRDMFAFLSDYATLSDPGTRLLISGDKLDFLVADLRRRMPAVYQFYEYHAKTSGDVEEEERLLKFAEKARKFSRPVGNTRLDKVAYIDAVMNFQHTSGFIVPLLFGISDYGREDYWPRKLLAFLRTHGTPGMVRENTAPDAGKPKINWNLNVREGKIVYMPPEEYMERVNIFNRIGMSRVIEEEQRAAGKGYRGIGYYPPLSESSYRSILEGIRAGNEMDIPNIVYRNGMVENQEGFHRSLVARDIGIEKIPVHVFGDMPSVFIRALNLTWNPNLTEQVKAINSLKGKVIGGIQMIRESTAPGTEPANNGFRANPNLINRELAMRSHSGTSFDPEKRGEQEIAEFVSYVQDVYERLKKHAKTDRQKQYLLAEIERFQSAFAGKYNAKLSAQGGCISTMIAGPSGFPVHRAEKACSAADKRYEELIEFRDRAEAAILRELKKMAVEEAGGEVEVLKKKIADAERNHEFMVQTNKIVRKKIPDDQKIREIMALGKISETTVREILKPDYMGHIGFPAWALSNDTANIHRMKERLVELQKREVTPTGEMTFTGGSIVDNREADRVQIIFDQRPSQEMINRLKSEGWRWSPANVAWQRKRTDAALISARRITGVAQPAAPAVQPPVPAVQPRAVPAPAPASNIIDLARLRASEWFKAQVSNPYERYYLYHRIGDFRVSNIEPQGYTLSDAERISPAWTVEQAAQWIIGIAQRLPVLPLDTVPAPAPAHAVQPPAAVPREVPQPYELPELKWVYGTRDQKWHLVGPEDRDYVHGIAQQRMKQIGPEAARAEYLSPALARAAQPAVPALQVPAVPVPPKYPPLLYPAPRQRPAEETMFVANPETMTRAEFVEEKYSRMAQVLRQQGKEVIAVRIEKGVRDPEWTFKFETSHRDQVVLALAQGKTVPPHVLKDYPDIVGRVRKENEEILSRERAERERLLAMERAEENELNAELNRLPPPLKRHAETEIYGILHLPETDKDYHKRYYTALGKVRQIAFAHMPQKPQPQPAVKMEPWEMAQEEYWRAGAGGRAFEGRATSDYNHKQAVYRAITEGKSVPARVLQDYPDLRTLELRGMIKKEVPAASVKVPWPAPKPEPKKFVQQTFTVEERMRRNGGYGGYGGRGYA